MKKGLPVAVSITPSKEYDIYKNISVNLESNIFPENAINQPITREKLISQFSKTTDTPFEFSTFQIDLDDNLYIPSLKEINALRRESLEKMEFLVSKKFTRVPIKVNTKSFCDKPHSKSKVSLLLLSLNPNFDYSKMEFVDRVYIPLRCFLDNKNKEVIKVITSKFSTYIFLPTIINLNYMNLLDIYITSFISSYNIAGFVLSSIGELEFLRDEKYKRFDFVANYSLNAFNDYTINELACNNINTVTLSPELNKLDIQTINSSVNKELIVYGKIKVMTSKYCFLGHSNLCYPKCDSKCQNR